MFKRHRVNDLREFVKKHKLAEAKEADKMKKPELVDLIIKSSKTKKSKKIESRFREELTKRKRVPKQLITEKKCNPVLDLLKCALSKDSDKCLRQSLKVCKPEQLKSFELTKDGKKIDIGQTILNTYTKGSTHKDYPIPQSLARKALELQMINDESKKQEMLEKMLPEVLKLERVEGDVLPPLPDLEDIPEDEMKKMKDLQDEKLTAGKNFKPIIKSEKKPLKKVSRGSTVRDVVSQIQKGVDAYFQKYPCYAMERPGMDMLERQRLADLDDDLPPIPNLEDIPQDELRRMRRKRQLMLEEAQAEEGKHDRPVKMIEQRPLPEHPLYREIVEIPKLTTRSQAEEDFILRQRVKRKLDKDPTEHKKEVDTVRHVPEEIQKLFIDFSEPAEEKLVRPLPPGPPPTTEDEDDNDTDEGDVFDDFSIKFSTPDKPKVILPTEMQVSKPKEFISEPKSDIEQLSKILPKTEPRTEMKRKRTRQRKQKLDPLTAKEETDKFKSIIESLNL
jgi:hypothetical protein